MPSSATVEIRKRGFWTAEDFEAVLKELDEARAALVEIAAECQRMREAVRWYADGDNWVEKMRGATGRNYALAVLDCGVRARATLEGTK